MASNPQWAHGSPTSRRSLRKETGSDRGGQHGVKYRIRGLSRGVKPADPLRPTEPSTLRPIRYRRIPHRWGWDPTMKKRIESDFPYANSGKHRVFTRMR